jgi:hypothetical protein
MAKVSLSVFLCRLNDAPVRGYEDDVGNKTTMRLFYPESASYNPSMHNDPDTLMVLVPFKQQDLRWLKEILYDEKRVLDVCVHTPLFCLLPCYLPSSHAVTKYAESMAALPNLLEHFNCGLSSPNTPTLWFSSGCYGRS